MTASGVGGWTEAEAGRLRPYVSNLDRPVYAITGLPEEVVAVLFAYVSRSPLGFRENLLRLLAEDPAVLAVSPGGDGGDGADGADGVAAARERARAFHERWVIGYGHASVAEHATVHLGVEGISRLASAELELANPHLSFTEYSQRYQRPRPGAYVVPPGLPETHREAYRRLQDDLFARYELLERGLVPFLRASLERRPGESEAALEGRVRRAAFEDARYTLSLATRTNLGLTGNARALRDAIALLLTSPYAEVRRLAEDLRREALTATPTLLRHAQPNRYVAATRADLAAALTDLLRKPPRVPRLTGGVARQTEAGSAARSPSVRLLDWTGRGEPDAEEAALDLVTAALLHPLVHGDRRPLLDLRERSRAEKRELFRRAVAHLGPHDEALPALHCLRYRVEFTLSEAAWHQLLRHNRKMDFFPAPPSAQGEPVVPPAVAAAGLADVLLEAAAQAGSLAAILAEAEPVEGPVAPYAVINAHRRRVLADVDAWQLVHLANLRGRPETQWELRGAVRALWDAAVAVHPFLADVRPHPWRGETGSS
ncbi:MAG: FAD-dependent thymidylate synthase [Clostridia bacterium]|nr:FAD-dependent thymidylate synthase [Clostridia bacterium]